MQIDPIRTLDGIAEPDGSCRKTQEAGRAAILGVTYQGVFAVTQLIALAVLARHTTRELFGLWMTVMALASWAPIACFGQPAALLTRLGAVARADQAEGRRLFMAGSVITAAVTALLLAITLCASPWLPWPTILNANTPGTALLAQPTALLAIVVALLANPATIANFALLAHQRGDVAYASMIAASVVGLLLFVGGVWSGQPLPIAGALLLIGPLLGGLALWAVVASGRLIRLPRWRELDRGALKTMALTGLHFVAIDASMLAIIRTPDLIVAQLRGPEAVAVFSAVGRLPMLMLTVFHAMLLPFWPILAEAHLAGDVARLKRTAFRSLWLMLAIGGVGTAALVVLGAPFVRVWLGIDDPEIVPLVRAACLQALGMGVLAWLGVLFSALSMLRYQLALLSATAMLFLLLAFAAGHAFGPLGVALAQGASLLLFMGSIGVWLLRRNPSVREALRDTR